MLANHWKRYDILDYKRVRVCARVKHVFFNHCHHICRKAYLHVFFLICMLFKPAQRAKFMGPMRPTWVLSAPSGPHVGPMNLAIRVYQYIVNIFWNFEKPILSNSHVWFLTYEHTDRIAHRCLGPDYTILVHFLCCSIYYSSSQRCGWKIYFHKAKCLL